MKKSIISAVILSFISSAAFADCESSINFYSKVKNVVAKDIPALFGMPDKISSVKAPNGDMVGVTWTYVNKVDATSGVADAKFTFVEGNLALVSVE